MDYEIGVVNVPSYLRVAMISAAWGFWGGATSIAAIYVDLYKPC